MVCKKYARGREGLYSGLREDIPELAAVKGATQLVSTFPLLATKALFKRRETLEFARHRGII